MLIFSTFLFCRPLAMSNNEELFAIFCGFAEFFLEK